MADGSTRELDLQYPGDRMLIALAMPDLTPPEKIVLAALAWHDGEFGCYPSMQTVADELDITRNTVNRHIRALKRKGILTIERRRKQDKQASNSYVINYAPRVTPVVTLESDQSNSPVFQSNNPGFQSNSPARQSNRKADSRVTPVVTQTGSNRTGSIEQESKTGIKEQEGQSEKRKKRNRSGTPDPEKLKRLKDLTATITQNAPSTGGGRLNKRERPERPEFVKPKARPGESQADYDLRCTRAQEQFVKMLNDNPNEWR